MSLEVLNSVGIEIEVSPDKNLRRNLKLLCPKDWATDRDGSCTEVRGNLGSLPVMVANGGLSDFIHGEESGGELISPILSFTDPGKINRDIEFIMTKLVKSGEVLSDCTGIHVHINMGKYPPVDVLKNLLNIWCGLEAPMFRLSTGEMKVHRGISHNDYMYCRPITGKGRQIVLDADYGAYFYAFDVTKLYKASTADSFIMAFCRADIQETKWMPARYYAINFMSLPRRGTIEFRLFNSSLQPEYILAWMDLSRAICAKAWSIPEVMEALPLGSCPNIGFEYVARHLEEYFVFPEQTIKALEEIWFKSDWQQGVDDQVNHLVLRNRRTLPMHGIPIDLRPDIVSTDYVRSISERGS